jgi:hypothetical protein
MQSCEIVVLTAVKQNGMALRYASQEMQNDQAVVSEAVKQNGLALEYASRAMQSSETIIIEAMKQNVLALSFAGDTSDFFRPIAVALFCSICNTDVWQRQHLHTDLIPVESANYWNDLLHAAC